MLTSTESMAKTGDAAAPSDQMETISEQLREYWALYRSTQPPEHTVAVDCEKITKGFIGSRFQLEELSFSLKTGQITGVVGRNASGKTTLLRMIRGEILPDGGNIRYPGLTRGGDSWPHIKRQINYIPQFPKAWTGRLKTNLHFIAAVHGITGKRNYDLVDWYTERYGLGEYKYFRWGNLSGGFRMRSELVRSLIYSPKLLVLDEPLASLDVLARHEFLKNLRAIAYSLDEPVPIIVTSQHLYEIEAIADQMIILDAGKCLFCGSLKEIGQQSATRLFELNINLAKRLMRDKLQSLNMTILETVADGYIVGTLPNVASHDAMKSLVEIFGDSLLGIRDITGSSRRFFVEAFGKGKVNRG